MADAKAFAAALAKVPAQSVAVLPLANESGDPSQDYFSDGLSEQLISDLTQIDGLKVIGKSSSFQFRDGKTGLAEIGARLGVANLIEGSVRQRSKRLRVVVNLIRASDGTSVWSHTYDQPLEDVFAIQSQIGGAVAAALKIKLVGAAPDAGEKPPSGNVAAYQALLQGRALARHFTEENMRRAIALERKAIELDPRYAYAWAVLSNSLSNLSVLVNGDSERMQALADARAAADKAMELAPGMAAAHRARSSVLQNDGDLAGSLSESRRALELAPNDGNSMTFFANALGSAGQTGQAETLYRKALATDPLRVDWHLNLANALIRLDRLDEAEQALHAAAALRPDYPGLHQFLTTLRILRGDAAGALHEARQEAEANQEFPVAEALQASSDREKADAALHGFIARHDADDPYSIAILFAVRGDPDRMFEWLERGWSARETVGVWSMYDNAFMLRYKSDPRFAAYCRKIGVPAPDELTADTFDVG
jgi:TolB-like protein/tetratricopeptide (TPR) repeat protein